MDFHIGNWLKGTLEIASWASVIGALTTILPPIASLLGIVYWGIMIHNALKDKDR